MWESAGDADAGLLLLASLDKLIKDEFHGKINQHLVSQNTVNDSCSLSDGTDQLQICTNSLVVSKRARKRIFFPADTELTLRKSNGSPRYKVG